MDAPCLIVFLSCREVLLWAKYVEKPRIDVSRWAAQVMTLGEPRGVGGLAGTATGYSMRLFCTGLRVSIV